MLNDPQKALDVRRSLWAPQAHSAAPIPHDEEVLAEHLNVPIPLLLVGTLTYPQFEVFTESSAEDVLQFLEERLARGIGTIAAEFQAAAVDPVGYIIRSVRHVLVAPNDASQVDIWRR